MRKWSFSLIVALSVCMVGCANEQDTHVNSKINCKSESMEISADGNVNEKIDENLYVEADFHLPKEELFSYSSELKQFDNDKVQSILWPAASAEKVKTDEFGSRCYGNASFGLEKGCLVYRVNNDVNYIDTLCSYTKEKNIKFEKNLKFATIEKAKSEAEEFISKFGIGCELGEPYIVALNGKDLNKIQEKIMKDDDYKDILKAKKLGNNQFNSKTEIYYLEYSFVINDIPVFGHDDPMMQLSGDNPLLAQSMRAKIIISKSGIEELFLEGVLDNLVKSSDKAEIIGYEGIKEALEKKFGDVILTDKYKLTNIWMEYFPLIESDSFSKVEVIPVWCCDFEINGKAIDYTLRFHALTGEEIS